MRILDFKVDKQKLGKQPGSDFTNIVAGTADYLRAIFHFSEDWDACAKVATFKGVDGIEHNARLGADDGCYIPAEALTGEHFTVYVTGARIKTGYKVRTSEFKVRQEVF